MRFFNFVFHAVSLFVSSEFFWLWFGPLFALFFIATVPRIIRELFLWR